MEGGLERGDMDVSIEFNALSQFIQSLKISFYL